MSKDQEATFSLVLLIVLILALAVVGKLRDLVALVFQYQHVELDLNPINPAFKFPTPQINVQNPFNKSGGQ